MESAEIKCERSCLVCRGKAPKRELLRFVWSEGRLLFDEKQRLPGRGAYIHATHRCINGSLAGSKWERALRLPKGSLGEKMAGAWAASLPGVSNIPKENVQQGWKRIRL